MQREILFKAIALDSKEWVEGDLVQALDKSPERYAVIPQTSKLYVYTQYEVIPETVCQYTGLKTEKYKRNLDPRVFEGDLFRQERENFQGKEYIQVLVVMWIRQLAAFYLIPEEHYQIMLDNDVSNEPEFAWLFDAAMLHDFSLDSGLTKVGNIHDHHTT